MPSLKDLHAFLEALSPLGLQESWDHCGLNLGSLDMQYQHLIISLEATMPLAKQALNHSVILTHHPLFFKPFKTFNPDFYPYNIAQILIQKSCALLAWHTNFDKTHLNAHFAKILGFENLHTEGMALVGAIAPTPLKTLAKSVQDKLNLPYVRYVSASSIISTLAIVCGAGCGYLQELKAMPQNLCLITGDIKHHDAMAAQSMGISLVEVPHYESEKYFVPLMANLLAPIAPNPQLFDCRNALEVVGLSHRSRVVAHGKG
ncbi:Nif3-like dinuclear metal center hexameric protein [Helicobacter sp. L8]|uniref:Nif3-like dinuclear metal center hexameric protein n=1 Tax=Helicobacter sp. L8 TaxID=2316078 RepID=UPI000EAF91A3|nr:Nif3-like dinuclear metal center hexameric protein [Helicobacter sp. L8]